MKYVISESRLYQFVNDYLNSFSEVKATTYLDSYIVISEPAQDESQTWEDYIEYDYSDGRLWINRDFLTNISDLSFNDKEKTMRFIAKWFDDKFDVKTKSIQS